MERSAPDIAAATTPPRPRYARRVAARRLCLVWLCWCAALTVVVLAASAAAANGPGQVTRIYWTGQETLSASSYDYAKRLELTYKFSVRWKASWDWNPKLKLMRPQTAGSVSGTASRINSDGSVLCSGAVTGRVGTPAVSIDKVGNVVFEAAAIPGWAGGGDLNTCYGGLVPPIGVGDVSRQRMEFKARAKLSSLLNGSASASDSNGFSTYSTYQGQVCIAGCIKHTAATDGGYTSIGSGKPTPNPNDPKHSIKGKLTWSSTVSTGLGTAIRILDATTGKDVTGKTLTYAVGEPVELRVENVGGGVPTDPTWAVPGIGSDPKSAAAIKDYSITPTTGTVEGLSGDDLRSERVKLYFVKPDSYRVGVTASGRTERVSLVVSAPKVASNAQLCKVGVATTSHHPALPGTILGLGYTDQCPTSQGIQWHFQVSASAGGSGRIAMTQLITKTVTHQGGGLGKPKTCPDLTVTTPLADAGSFYDQFRKPSWIVALPSGGFANWEDTDSPHIPLRAVPLLPGQPWYEKFDAVDYLMYKSAVAKSIWVPVAKLTWGWRGLASYALPPGVWRFEGGGTTGPTFSEQVDTLPEWPGVLATDTAVKC